VRVNGEAESELVRRSDQQIRFETAYFSSS